MSFGLYFKKLTRLTFSTLSLTLERMGFPSLNNCYKHLTPTICFQGSTNCKLDFTPLYFSVNLIFTTLFPSILRSKILMEHSQHSSQGDLVCKLTPQLILIESQDFFLCTPLSFLTMVVVRSPTLHFFDEAHHSSLFLPYHLWWQSLKSLWCIFPLEQVLKSCSSNSCSTMLGNLDLSSLLKLKFSLVPLLGS